MFLDFATLRDVLASRQATGMLKAVTNDSVKGLRCPCNIEVTVQEGQILSCRITDRDGRVLDNAQAILLSLPPLEWSIDVHQTAHVSSPTTQVRSPVRSPVPRRIQTALPEDFASWPRLARQVYLAIDGRNDLEKLALLFRRTPDQMADLLKEFQAKRLVSFD